MRPFWGGGGACHSALYQRRGMRPFFWGGGRMPQCLVPEAGDEALWDGGADPWCSSLPLQEVSDASHQCPRWWKGLYACVCYGSQHLSRGQGCAYQFWGGGGGGG